MNPAASSRRDSGALDRAFARFCEQGTSADLALVYEALVGQLRRDAFAMLRDHGAADDLVQTTFVAAIELRAQFDRGARVEPWLRGLLRNRGLHALRERRRWTELPEASVPPSVSDFGERITNRELHQRCLAAVAQLDEPYRSVVEEVVLRGRSPEELARATGCPSSTVRSQVRRGLARVRAVVPGVLAGWVRALGRGMLPARRAAVLGGALLVLGLGVVVWRDSRTGLEVSRLATVRSSASVVGYRAAGGSEPMAVGPALREAAPPSIAPFAAVSDAPPATGRSDHAMLRWARNHEPAGGFEVLVETDTAEYRVERVPGSGRLMPLAAGDRRVMLPWARLESPRVPAGAEWMIPPGFDVHGRVVDGLGKPVAGVAVEWSATSARAPRSDRPLLEVCRTDSDGRFRCRDLSPSLEHRLTVRRSGLSASIVVTGSTSSELTREMVLEPLTGTMEAPIREPRERPRRRADSLVEVQVETNGVVQLTGWTALALSRDDDEPLARVRLGASGRARFYAASCPTRLVVQPPRPGEASGRDGLPNSTPLGSRPLSMWPSSAVVGLESEGSVLRARFAPEQLPTSYLTFRSAQRVASAVILDPSGCPRGVYPRSSTAAEDRTWRLGPIRPGTWTLALSPDGDAPWRYVGPVVLAANETLPITIPPTERATLSLRPPPGQPARDLVLTICAAGVPILRRSERWWEAPLPLASGRYEVFWASSSVGARRVEVDLTGGERVIDLAASPGVPCPFELVYPGRIRPVDGLGSADVRVSRDGRLVWRERIAGRLDSAGRLGWTRALPPGRYVVTAIDRRGAQGQAVVEVPIHPAARRAHATVVELR